MEGFCLDGVCLPNSSGVLATPPLLVPGRTGETKGLSLTPGPDAGTAPAESSCVARGLGFFFGFTKKNEQDFLVY